jgi:hypothetical protein
MVPFGRGPDVGRRTEVNGMELAHNRALVVGVGADLPNTVADAKGLAQVLADSTRCGFPPANVAALTGEQATRAGILDALDRLIQSAAPDSTALVYFSGHGYQVESPTGEAYYLMPHGYDVNKLYKTCISGKEFADRLAAVPAQRLLLLLDCCHAQGVGESKAAGLTLTKSPIPPEAQALFAQGSGRILIASCKSSELSFTGTPFSLFTRAIVECLCGADAKDGDGLVRALDLALYASRMVSKWSRDRQHPTADTQKADNFGVAYYAAGAKAPLPLDLPPVDEGQVEADNAQAIRMLQQVTQTGGVNFGQGNTVSIAGDVVAGDKIMGDKIDARGAQGFIYKASGPVTQNFGTQIHTGGGAYVGGGVSTGGGAFAGRDMGAPASPADQLAGLVQELRAALASARLDADEKEAVDADLAGVEEQLAKPEPKLSLLKRGLNNVREVVESAAGIGSAALTLAPLVQKALELAQQIGR